MANDAGEFTLGARGELGREIFLFVLEFEEAHLDEFMIAQGLIGFGDDGVRHALFTDHHDRIEMVRQGS